MKELTLIPELTDGGNNLSELSGTETSGKIQLFCLLSAFNSLRVFLVCKCLLLYKCLFLHGID